MSKYVISDNKGSLRGIFSNKTIVFTKLSKYFNDENNQCDNSDDKILMHKDENKWVELTYARMNSHFKYNDCFTVKCGNLGFKVWQVNINEDFKPRGFIKNTKKSY